MNTTMKIELVGKHVLAWLVLIILPHLFVDRAFNPEILLMHALMYVAPIVVFYIHSDWILPYLYIKRKYLYYFLSILGLCCLFFIIQRVMAPAFVRFNVLIGRENFDYSMEVGPNFFVFFITVAASGMYGYSIQNAKRERVLKEMEKQQAESNLQLLKSQLSPHFLFNAMNSLYSLSLKKSDELPNAILTFSDLLRYNTYDSAEDYVNVEKEIEYLQNYIRLQKLRLAQESTIVFNVERETSSSVKIAPMILIPFVENAFKHGRGADGAVDIDIHIVVREDKILFTVENKIFVEGSKDAVHGIGIQNVKTRLQLIYGSKHDLVITECKTKYRVDLKLKL